LIDGNFFNKKINVSIELDMNSDIRKYLEDKYYEDIKSLSLMFYKYPEIWMREIDCMK
jgi:NRPS condensation-like uncharacterized protein